jgi:hypothetical protein
MEGEKGKEGETEWKGRNENGKSERREGRLPQINLGRY